jgi:hypothetical protein
MKELIQTEGLSPEALAAWSAPYLAYVKPHMVAGEEAFAICAADGTRLGLSPSREIAFVAARQHDFEPLSVH